MRRATDAERRAVKRAKYVLWARANYRMTAELCALGDALREALGMAPLYVDTNAAGARGRK